MPLSSPLSRAALVAGCIAGGTAVALGAFAAHALRATLDGPSLATWQTGVDYQFRHALALLVVGLLARGQAGRGLPAAAIAFGVGIVLFCASLYALALGAPRWLGAVTPLGGLCFLAGWSLLLASILRRG